MASRLQRRLENQQAQGIDMSPLLNINAIYAFDENLSFNVSVKNLFNESVKREGTQASNAGANTFNEPERSFLLSATYQF